MRGSADSLLRLLYWNPIVIFPCQDFKNLTICECDDEALPCSWIVFLSKTFSAYFAGLQSKFCGSKLIYLILGYVTLNPCNHPFRSWSNHITSDKVPSLVVFFDLSAGHKLYKPASVLHVRSSDIRLVLLPQGDLVIHHN